MAMLPDAEKAYTDCTSGKKMPNLKTFGKVKDLPTCISDIELSLIHI